MKEISRLGDEVKREERKDELEEKKWRNIYRRRLKRGKEEAKKRLIEEGTRKDDKNSERKYE